MKGQEGQAGAREECNERGCSWINSNITRKDCKCNRKRSKNDGQRCLWRSWEATTIKLEREQGKGEQSHNREPHQSEPDRRKHISQKICRGVRIGGRVAFLRGWTS